MGFYLGDFYTGKVISVRCSFLFGGIFTHKAFTHRDFSLIDQYLVLSALLSFPPTYLSANTQYEKMADMFPGTKGFSPRTPRELEGALEEAMRISTGPVIVNVQINPLSQRKPQVINMWV